jgi:hypothetical protein
VTHDAQAGLIGAAVAMQAQLIVALVALAISTTLRRATGVASVMAKS